MILIKCKLRKMKLNKKIQITNLNIKCYKEKLISKNNKLSKNWNR